MNVAYPGKTANVHDILELAGHYKTAAIMLGERSPQGKPLSHIPRRFLALHSIELYLNAFLLAKGLDPKTIRGLQHDIGERSRRAAEAGLILRKRTAQHLETLSSNREYLVTRYGPEMSAPLSQVNRVMATLDELSQKVGKIVDGCVTAAQGRP
ncbi:hypothetical protein HFN51_27850 [Rhizobium leguminosarum]|nr:hypothetical protein [Rhizobium leguminosarum]